MTFPQHRLRRLRRTPALRRLVAETRLGVDDLVAPLFVREGLDQPVPISSLPGVVQHSRSSLRSEVAELVSLGVNAVILFGIPESKDARGSGASDADGIVQVAIRELRDEFGDQIVLMADLCLDEYTDHGHCGLLQRQRPVVPICRCRAGSGRLQGKSGFFGFGWRFDRGHRGPQPGLAHPHFVRSAIFGRLHGAGHRGDFGHGVHGLHPIPGSARQKAW